MSLLGAPPSCVRFVLSPLRDTIHLDAAPGILLVEGRKDM